jgi:cholera toxin transcriptional activator
MYRATSLPVGAKLRRVVMQKNGSIARFGVFELDGSTGELRKNGLKLRLQGQPLQVLALLLERAGEVVTRDELRQSLWASDTFVDFDHGLNTAINRVREVLGDSASSPRYIETLARRGYRFIAPVQNLSRPESALPDTSALTPPQQPAAAGTPVVSETTPVNIHPELEIPIPHRGVSRGLFALIQLMYLIFYVVALFRLHAIEGMADSFLPLWAATTLAGVVMVSAGVGIPLRCYLISAAGFDYQRLAETFRRVFPALLALDELWAVAPFLLLQRLGLGGSFAVSAALLYVPFSERSLVRMAYPPKRP